MKNDQRNSCSDQADQNTLHDKRRPDEIIRRSDDLHNTNFFFSNSDTGTNRITDQEYGNADQNQDNNRRYNTYQSVKISQCICNHL